MTSSPVNTSDTQRQNAVPEREADVRRIPVFRLAIATFAMLSLACPPLQWAPLAWVAPVPLMLLVFPKSLAESSRVLTKVYVAAMMFWLVTFYFLPYPHPILIIGWVALSAYLALYTPLFVVCARTMTHRMRVPPVISIPVAWTGLEWVRVNFLTGFGMACLSHSQYAHPVLIQVSDLFGAYAVTFAITAFAAGLAYTCFVVWTSRAGCDPGEANSPLPKIATGVVCSIVAVGLTVGYGVTNLDGVSRSADQASGVGGAGVGGQPSTRIALIQSSLDTILVPPAGEDAHNKRFDDFRHRMEISHRARLADEKIDLMVWPESAFPTPDHLPTDAGDSIAWQYATAISSYWDKGVNDVGRFDRLPLIAGTTTYDKANEAVYNAAILIDDSGEVSARYFKNHRVMIGEYTPILEYFPKVMQRFPYLRSLTAGEGSCVMDSGGVAIAPNVCFETTVPHYLSKQLNSLAADGQEPDVMLNITNDGWFFGSTCLDLHFACNVFRAVEMRKPMLVCANTGFSAHIAPDGRVLKKGPRRATEYLICDVQKAIVPNVSVYRRWGSWIPFSMGWISVMVLILARWKPSTT